MVIAFSKEQANEASKLFPGALVLLPEEVVGLEYKKVILYNPFHSKSLLSEENQKTFQDRYSSKLSAPTNYPKDTKNIKYAVPFNEFFVAVTRSTSDLYILDVKITEGTGTAKKGKKSGAPEAPRFGRVRTNLKVN